MRTLVVFSGKGGAGKTSVAAGLAPLLRDAVFADADVDAANMALALGARARHTEPFADREVARIDASACTGCGACEQTCRFGGIVPPGAAGEAYRVDEVACEGCGACRLVCPEQGITLHQAVTGHWSLSDTPFGTLVHAELAAGGQSSGGLVKKVRAEAERVARRQGRSRILVDGPAGTGCPVISALTGADGALVVTEPTPSGIADLERALDLARHVGVPCGVVVNKADLNAGRAAEIERITAERGVPILERLPYDDAVARTAREGWLPSIPPGPWRRRFEQIRDGLETTIASESATAGASAGEGERP
jgi:MinD superfamily P-loop ATPase